MAKPKKWPPKFKTPITSIARLSKSPSQPFPMVGDPPEAKGKDWSTRSKILYHWWQAKQMDGNLERTGTYGD